MFLRGSPLDSEFIAFARAQRWARARSDPFEDSRKKCEFLGCGTCQNLTCFSILKVPWILARSFLMHLAGIIEYRRSHGIRVLQFNTYPSRRNGMDDTWAHVKFSILRLHQEVSRLGKESWGLFFSSTDILVILCDFAILPPTSI
jgi:hypothetical protein